MKLGESRAESVLGVASNPSALNAQAQRLLAAIRESDPDFELPPSTGQYQASWDDAERIAREGAGSYRRAVSMHDLDVREKHLDELGEWLFGQL